MLLLLRLICGPYMHTFSGRDNNEGKVAELLP